MWAQGRKQPSLRPQLVVPTALGLRESPGGGGVWERSQGMSRAPRLSELPPSFTCSPVPSGSIRPVAQETWT